MTRLLERAGEDAGHEFTKQLNEIVRHRYSKLCNHLIYFFRLMLAVNELAVSMSTAFAIQSGYGQASSGSLLSQFHEIFLVSITQLLAGSYAQ
jgi:hypothetical protein